MGMTDIMDITDTTPHDLYAADDLYATDDKNLEKNNGPQRNIVADYHRCNLIILYGVNINYSSYSNTRKNREHKIKQERIESTKVHRLS